MPKRKAEPEETVRFGIVFPLTRKKRAKERKILLGKMKSLIERDKKLPTKDTSSRKYVISLGADEFGALISFDKPISIQIAVSKDIEKNKNRVNDLANKLVNYINTLLGESARHAKAVADWRIPRPKGINIAKKFIEETRLAKINELTKKTLDPTGIMFRYTSDKHENTVMHFYSEDATLAAELSRSEYKEGVPWDFIIEEYKNWEESIDIIRKLAQKEF